MEPRKIFRRVLWNFSWVRLTHYLDPVMAKSTNPRRKSSLRRLLKFLDAVCAEIGLPADNYAKAFKA
jgi:hypothetical protein